MGVLWDFIKSLATESFPPKSKFTIQDVPDLSGKVIIVTGGNSGLGFATSKVLVERGAKVYIATRNETKAKEAIEQITKETGKAPLFLKLDLADLDSIQGAANTFLSQETRLDVLYNSAGVMIPPKSEVTKQGYDLQFGVNVLGHFYLTKLLLPLLISTAKSSAEGKARIVTVSSGAHHMSNLTFSTFKDGPVRQKANEWVLYGQSKYGAVVLAKELARRYGGEGIVSLGMNPGNINTNLQKELPGWQATFVKMTIMNPILPNGITTHLWAGTAPETAEYNGKYLIPWARVGTPRADSQDEAVGKELWTWLEEQVTGR
ncbi:NAD-P-binding protein [Mycena metata]|uniref:NAD-P-binding protein n=1 Tax=Mycena metata TaxID=1033252 RepID=A0AAD7IXJ7_9AGAR|nr:NAD-P-binding protein [Mycena metata]